MPNDIHPAVTEGQAMEAVETILRFIGEDPDRQGLRDTPGRVVRAWCEMTAGYHEDPQRILGTVFEETSEQQVILRGIRFTSTCEHHMLPFTGHVDVAYLPGENVVGLSKLARVVAVYARRLQIQERMTREIMEAIDNALSPRGVIVIVRAHHSCMGCRGAMQPGAEMITTAMSGEFLTDPEAHRQFLAVVGGLK
jgi:GTP cyclohydrolase IA